MAIDLSRQAKDQPDYSLIADERSGEAQYRVFSMPVHGPVPGTDRIADVALGYRRCHDFDLKDNPGQDCAVAIAGDGYIVGVVTDGVSQSFYGHIAARSVADALKEDLWGNRFNPPDKEVMEDRLRELMKDVDRWVQELDLPLNLPEMQREALERIRANGSQTVFAAFVLDARRRRLHLYQVGDIISLIHQERGGQRKIPAEKKGRWSSAGRSKMLLQESDFEDIASVVIKSDGADPVWGLSAGVINEGAFQEMAEKCAGKDDVSFVAAAFRHPHEPPSFGRSAAAPRTERRPELPEMPAYVKPAVDHTWHRRSGGNMKDAHFDEVGPQGPRRIKWRGTIGGWFRRISLIVITLSSLLTGFMFGYVASKSTNIFSYSPAPNNQKESRRGDASSDKSKEQDKKSVKRWIQQVTRVSDFGAGTIFGVVLVGVLIYLKRRIMSLLTRNTRRRDPQPPSFSKRL